MVSLLPKYKGCCLIFYDLFSNSRCKLSCQAPPRSIKLKKGKGYNSKKKKDTGEEVTVEGTPRTPITQKEDGARSDEGKNKQKNQ